MGDLLNFKGVLRDLTWDHIGMILAILVASRVLVGLTRWVIGRMAERAHPRWRLRLLRLPPLLRLSIDFASLVLIVPILVEPTFENIMVLGAAVFLGLAFAMKDYASSLLAGLTAILENTYQPGDWVEVDGTYGEVKSIGLRALQIVTPDDTEVIIPHSRLWATAFHNASSGNRSILCVADFYLNPEHDAAKARAALAKTAEASALRQPKTPVTVIVLEKPWGTHYRVKAYVRESREQFLLTSDITVRGKEALRRLKIKFAQAPYAAGGK